MKLLKKILRPGMVLLAVAVVCSMASLIFVVLTGVFFGISVNSDAESYSVPTNCTVISPLVQCEQSYGKRKTKYCSAIVCLNNVIKNSTSTVNTLHSLNTPQSTMINQQKSCPQSNTRTTFRFEDSTIFYTYSEGFETTCFVNPKDRLWVSYEIYTPASSHWKIIGIISAIGSIICGVCAIIMFYRFYQDRKTLMASSEEFAHSDERRRRVDEQYYAEDELQEE
ncbi:hypothetical protein C9374_003534 [Naegleria lovaniensis]|uniref:Uncharacterized protein n=1 Tax=Naegleria lovaniensis TaxID=51637 RepID=A0AA88KLD2_NAELO|nr:uncharacterized protein C9374_003534 [Naegleria lovaniensis]KAG2385719.1 hypothetical protein C9374_003534 [Naegleria lovaniensis]